MRHRNPPGTGREIIETLLPRPEDQYDAIDNMSLKTQKKFCHVSTVVRYDYNVKKKLEELQAQKFPYRVSSKIEWFEPNEENELHQRKQKKEVMVGDSSPT